MSAAVRVSGISVCEDRTSVELSARLSGAKLGPRDGGRLWFRYPASLARWLAPTPEAFVAALLPIAMALGADLEADAPVCPVFASGCAGIAEIYREWDRRLRPVQLKLTTAGPTSVAGEGAVACFFTAGVDSYYTVLKNLATEHGDSRITHLLFISGYSDCPLGNRMLVDRMTSRLAEAAAALSVQFVHVSTNLREFTPCSPPGWDWFAGSQLASAALGLGGGLRRALIPAGDTYPTLSPWGSHPLVDPLWSTAALEFRHDGAEARRSEKLDRFVARSPLALGSLRVCGYEREGLRNCGICEKCLRTRVGLAALGVAEPEGLFGGTLDAARVRAMNGGDRVVAYYLRDNLRLLGTTQLRPDLRAAVAQALRPDPVRFVLQKAQWLGREVDRAVLGGRVRSWALRKAGDSVERQTALRVAPHRWLLREFRQAVMRPNEERRG